MCTAFSYTFFPFRTLSAIRFPRKPDTSANVCSLFVNLYDLSYTRYGIRPPRKPLCRNVYYSTTSWYTRRVQSRKTHNNGNETATCPKTFDRAMTSHFRAVSTAVWKWPARSATKTVLFAFTQSHLYFHTICVTVTCAV